MRLRAKVLIIFGLTLPVLAVVLSAASRLLLRGFERVEASAAQEFLQLASGHLAAMQEDLANTTENWAAREGTRRWSQAAASQPAEALQLVVPLNDLDVDLAVVLGPDRQATWSAQRAGGTESISALPEDVLMALVSATRINPAAGAAAGRHEIVALPPGLCLVAAQPIWAPSGEPSANATVILGRWLASSTTSPAARCGWEGVSIHPLKACAATPGLADLVDTLGPTDTPDTLVRTLDKERIGAYGIIRDADARPVALLAVERDRGIHRQGRAAVYCLSILICAFAVFCPTVTLLLLDRFVLARISRLSRLVTAFGQGQRPPRTPRPRYPDELTLLGESLEDTLGALLTSQDRLQITQFSIDNAADPVVWVAADARLSYVNEAASRMLGYTREELLKMTVFDLDPGTCPETWAARWADVSRRGSKIVETLHRTKDGRLIPVEITITVMQFQDAEYHCDFVRDITDRKRSDERLRHAATHDALTGLPNRALLTEHLAQAIALARTEPDYQFAVMFLDFDRFKIINDSLGHQAGDELLIAISGMLHDCLSSREVAIHMASGEVARIGGDEFVILLEGIRCPDDAVAVADRIQREVARPFVVCGHQAQVTVSIGIVTSELAYEFPADILRDADTAMYQAKARGKARHVVFDRQMHAEAMARLRLESDLRQAIEAQQINVVYQPIVSLESGELEGFEALSRWRHPIHGDISPDQFIPIAEETGLILPLGRMVLRRSCRQWVRFRQHAPDAAPVVMSVNVSKRQLMEPGLLADIEQVLHELNMPPQYLKLEVTESIIMHSADVVTPVLEDLKRLGVQLAMDDFGQGHSSLGSLHRYPIDCLKIDRAFVTNMGLTKAGLNIEYTAIVHAVITLAHNLGMQVVAEGVETVAQLVQLQALGCDFGQGHYFSRVTPGEGATELITAKTWLGAAAAQ